MILSDFRIGSEFWISDRRWRCTDIGTRVVVAVRVDELTVARSDGTKTVLTEADAEAQGWFRGPPYAVAETVFDEDDLEACSVDR